jgi:hypothetical protein
MPRPIDRKVDRRRRRREIGRWLRALQDWETDLAPGRLFDFEGRNVAPLRACIIRHLQEIADIPEEGCRREILRRVRDALDEHAGEYARRRSAREALREILTLLHRYETLLNADVAIAVRILQRAELYPRPLFPFIVEEETDARGDSDARDESDSHGEFET